MTGSPGYFFFLIRGLRAALRQRSIDTSFRKVGAGSCGCLGQGDSAAEPASAERAMRLVSSSNCSCDT